MNTTAVKIDESTIEVTKTIPVSEEIHEYKIEFLLKQLEDIQRQKDGFCAARDRELEEVKHLLSHCEKCEVYGTVEVVEITPVEETKTLMK
jgi:hypothetical protein